MTVYKQQADQLLSLVGDILDTNARTRSKNPQLPGIAIGAVNVSQKSG